MTRSMPLLIALTITVPCWAQARDGAQQDFDAARYAVNSAAFGALLGYCHARYGPTYGESPGGKCFNRGKQQLAKANLANAAQDLRAKCPTPATFSTCMTPHLGSTILALVVAFDAAGI